MTLLAWVALGCIIALATVVIGYIYAISDYRKMKQRNEYRAARQAYYPQERGETRMPNAGMTGSPNWPGSYALRRSERSRRELGSGE